ncbi:F-box/LRR-repeat protein At3g26922-like [Coffea arabica]|uniref:F-box/LRR-repeat protein At3g26922-like n=1 Tax=Coffea arabica TaxID=13443 RepID=A0A6P6X446_COFAR
MEKKAKKARSAPPQSRQMDWIDQLPEEILGNILSRMAMKEATRTSILSRRWRNLWKVYGSHLDFDASETMRLMFDGVKERHIEAPKYRDWVNQVLDSHEGSSLERLRIAFDLGGSYIYATAVDKWIDFAIVKRVQRLEVDLTAAAGCYTCSDSVYTFPSWLLDLPSDFPSFDRLTVLCLKSVSITEEDLAYFLSTCPFLEQLTVENSSSLQNFRVSGQSLKLKHLEIGYCQKLQNVEVSAASLVSFKYAGPRINICLIEVPELALVSFSNQYCEKFIINSPSSLYLSRLEKLELDLRFTGSARCVGFPSNFPKFSNLKHLELKFVAVADESALFFSSIIGASPGLITLTLKYDIDWATRHQTLSNPEVFRNQGMLDVCEKEWEEQARRYSHKCLNVIEFVGWAGIKTDVQLANYLLETAISLEKIIVDCRIPRYTRTSWNEELCPMPGNREAALLSAKELQRKLPPRAQLIIV